MKINKAMARKMWKEGKEFWITACNLRKECGLLIDPLRLAADFNGDFDKLVAAFTYYNCGQGAGRYPAYYMA